MTVIFWITCHSYFTTRTNWAVKWERALISFFIY